jgi:hypothetical protein
MHVGTDGFNATALSRVEAGGQQAVQAVLCAVLCEAEHLAVDEIGEDRVELLG